MSKSVQNADGSVTYDGQTFREGDGGVTIACCDGDLPLPAPAPGMLFTIEEIDPEDDTLYVNFRCTLTAWIPMAAAAMSPADPWEMPELKPWMRVRAGWYLYLVVEVEGKLFGTCAGSYLPIAQLKERATQIFSPPARSSGLILEKLLVPAACGELIWDSGEAAAARAAGVEARRRYLQDEMRKISAELDALS